MINMKKGVKDMSKTEISELKKKYKYETGVLDYAIKIKSLYPDDDVSIADVIKAMDMTKWIQGYR